MLSPEIKKENIRVLVIDDELETRAYFKDLFTQLGISCTVADDGLEVYRSVEEYGSYDLYFMDWDMDGIELTKKINAYKRNNIVLMTSSADWAVIKDMEIKTGISMYLLKPLFSSAIIDCVNECFGLSGGDKKFSVDVTGRFAGKKILLAEDVEINQEIIITLLENTGISVDCAHNGFEAVNMAASEKYDLILMDVQMPNMDGLEATRRLRAMGLNNLPIIAMTAHVFMSDIEECLAAGMNDHIGKPFDFNDLLKKLDKYLNAPELLKMSNEQ